MKHIKQFEAFPFYKLTTEAEKDEKELCWIIPTEKYQLKASLRKIGAPESIIERWGLSPNDINPIIDPICVQGTKFQQESQRIRMDMGKTYIRYYRIYNQNYNIQR